MKKLLSIVFVLFAGTVMLAQTTISGTITDAKTEQPLPGVNIKVVGKFIGSTTDFDGKFSFTTTEEMPFTIKISLVGFKSKMIEITQKNQIVNITLGESATILDEIVVSASRTPERILESPVTIERMDIVAIRNTSSPTFYDGLENLKGVDVNTSSLTFKSINTRGFATFANTRFMQLVDGMDNSSPALNFNLGNLLGMSELDVNSVELLPGASSALYGANAFNGILFMTSKNPFESEGISVYAKTGLTSQKEAGDNNFVDTGIRMAHKFSDKFAAKASFSFLKGTEWYATDYRNTDGTLGKYIDGSRADLNYDGLNVYGDEVSANINDVAQTMIFKEILPPGVDAFIPDVDVSRNGYNEVDLMDYDAVSAKADIAFHYKPFADDLEVIYNAKFGKGNTIYQGANRYNIKNFFMQQHKLEVIGDNFFARIYVTDEDAGDSYDSRFAAININRSWKSDDQWFGEYVGGYLAAFTNQVPGVTPGDSNAAHAFGRAMAQTGALTPGSEGFKNAFDQVTSDGDLTSGAKFIDQTKIYHADANYNFANEIDFADVMIGGSWRQYSLNSEGTIFTDYDGPIDYNEYGAYMQLQKKFIDDRLKFTGSIRYDKAKNFNGNVSPRVSVSYSLGKGKTRNVRASIQTGFRNPTTQDQYIGLDAGKAILVGSAPDNLDRYTSAPLNILRGQVFGFPSSVQLSGRDAYENSFTLTSVSAFAESVDQGAPNPGLLQAANFANVKPEKVTAFEIGYRAGFGRLALDMNAYYNQYKDFIGNKTVVAPLYGQVDFSDITPLPPALGGPIPTAVLALANKDVQPFQLYTNSSADISSYGGSIGVTSKIFGNYSVGLNYTLAKFDFDQDSDPDYEAGFNTPEHKIKFSFGNTALFENLGFNVNIRWNDEYFWESTFLDATIEANTVVDAQINYSVPSFKSTFKIGGANIGGKEYVSAPGVGRVGSQYYISWTINP